MKQLILALLILLSSGCFSGRVSGTIGSGQKPSVSATINIPIQREQTPVSKEESQDK